MILSYLFLMPLLYYWAKNWVYMNGVHLKLHEIGFLPNKLLIVSGEYYL